LRQYRIRVSAEFGEQSAQSSRVALQPDFKEPLAVGQPGVLGAPSFPRGQRGDPAGEVVGIDGIAGFRNERDAMAAGASFQVAPPAAQLGRLADERPPVNRDAAFRGGRFDPVDGQVRVGAADEEEEIHVGDLRPIRP